MQIPCQGYCPKFDSTMSWPLAKLLASTPKETIAPKQTKGGRRRSRKQSLTRSSAIILLTMKVRSGFLGGTYHHHVGQDEYRDDDYFAVEQTCNPIKIGFTFNCSHFNPSAFDPRPRGIPMLLSCIPQWLILWKIMATVDPLETLPHPLNTLPTWQDQTACLTLQHQPPSSALINTIGTAWINCCAKVLQLKCDKSGWFQIYQMTQTKSPRPSSAMDGSGGGLNTSMAKMESLVARIIRYVSLCTMGGWPEWRTTRGASYTNRIILFYTQWVTV